MKNKVTAGVLRNLGEICKFLTKYFRGNMDIEILHFLRIFDQNSTKSVQKINSSSDIETLNKKFSTFLLSFITLSNRITKYLLDLVIFFQFLKVLIKSVNII